MNPVIAITNLSYRYGSFMAVKDINITVNSGEIFGFLGPNGAGKTTTIRTILDFTRPTNGSISIFGLDSRRDAVEIHKRIGYLPSELTLWDNWTGIKYIKWLEDVYKKPLIMEANRLAEKLEFELKRPLKGLSTGMKRKMGLIAALCHKPELLILDEPTNGLDPLMQQVFHNLMLEARSEGRTVFLSSHLLNEVEQICDRVGIIRSGELSAIETVDKLINVTFRWMKIKTRQAAHIDGFDNIPGISDLNVNGNELLMRVSGEVNMDTVIKLVAKLDVEDIDIVKPTLEEIFLTFYGEKEILP